AGQHRGHAPVHGVEAVRLAEEVVRRLAAAADARQLGDAVRLDVQLPAGLDDRRRDRVVAAAGAQGADLALVVAAGEADRVAAERRVVELGLGEVGHGSLLLAPRRVPPDCCHPERSEGSACAAGWGSRSLAAPGMTAETCHATFSLADTVRTRSAIAPAMNRAVTGVPS